MQLNKKIINLKKSCKNFIIKNNKKQILFSLNIHDHNFKNKLHVRFIYSN